MAIADVFRNLADHRREFRVPANPAADQREVGEIVLHTMIELGRQSAGSPEDYRDTNSSNSIESGQNGTAVMATYPPKNQSVSKYFEDSGNRTAESHNP